MKHYIILSMISFFNIHFDLGDNRYVLWGKVYCCEVWSQSIKIVGNVKFRLVFTFGVTFDFDLDPVFTQIKSAWAVIYH